jgi:hypothetical protein
MIIEQVNQYDFVNAFTNSDTYKNNFTRPALFALFDHLDNESEEIESPLEFDMVAIACDYSEYKTAWEAMEQYQPEDMPIVDEEGLDLVELNTKQEQLALEWLNNKTTVITFDGGIIIQNF